MTLYERFIKQLKDEKIPTYSMSEKHLKRIIEISKELFEGGEECVESFTVEAFTGDGYDLVLCTQDELQIKSLSPYDYDTNILVIKKWANGKVVYSYIKEVSNQF